MKGTRTKRRKVDNTASYFVWGIAAMLAGLLVFQSVMLA